MSDILIKGMEMPKDIEPGLVIEFADGIDGKRYARLYHYRHGGLTEWLEAISVPPHGRCIDADTLEVHDGWMNEDRERNVQQTHITFVYSNDIFNAPTIIPAEPEVHDCDNCKWFGGLMCDHVDENYKCLGWEAWEDET